MSFWDDKFEFDFDDEFDKIAAAEEPPSTDDEKELRIAEAAIMEAESVVTDYETQRSARVELKAELDAKRKELEKQLNELTQKSQSIGWDLHEIQTNQRKAQRQVEEKKRDKIIAEQAIERRKKNEEKLASLAEIKDKCYWGDKVKEFQWTGIQYLTTAQRCILGDGMGLGKSLQTIAALDTVGSERALVIAQNDITTNFVREINKWSPNRQVLNLRGKSKAQRDTILKDIVPLMTNAVVVINYEAWRKDKALLSLLSDVGFDSVIIDEAHNIKGTDTNAYRGVKAIVGAANECGACGALMKNMVVKGKPVVLSNDRGYDFPQRTCPTCGWQGESIKQHEDLSEREIWQKTRTVKNVWAVTGTPILNKIEDLFALLSIIDPLNFNVKARFLREYGVMDPYKGTWGFRPGGADYLMKHRLRGKYLARSMKDAGIELPPQDITFHDMELDEEEYPDQFKVIRQLEEHAQIVLSDGAQLPMMEQIALLTRQRQANVWPGGIQWKMTDPNTGQERLVRVSEDVTDSIKIDKAIELIAEAIDGGRRVVVFSQFKQALVELEKRARGFVSDGSNTLNPVRFDGETNDSTKSKIKHEWDISTPDTPEHNVLLANYKVGGTGLNLTEASVTIILDSEWNPGKRDQAYARTHRMGQTENTIVHVLRVNKTVDAWLDSLMQAKEALIGGFSMAADEMQSAYLEAIRKGEIGV